MTGAAIKFLAALVLVLTSKHAAGALVQKAATIKPANDSPLFCQGEAEEAACAEAEDILETLRKRTLAVKGLRDSIEPLEKRIITWCVFGNHTALETAQLETLIEEVANLTAQSPKAIMYLMLKEDISNISDKDYNNLALMNEKLANWEAMYADIVFRILRENNATGIGAAGTQDELKDFEAKYPKGALQVYKEDIIKKEAEAKKCSAGSFLRRLEKTAEKKKLIYSLEALEKSYPEIALESLVEDIVNKDAEIAAKPHCAGAAKRGKEVLKGLLADLTYREKASTQKAIRKKLGQNTETTRVEAKILKDAVKQGNKNGR